MVADDLSSVAYLLYEMGTLKRARRTGWWMAGVRDPESIADHSWRTSLIASILARLVGADPARAALLAVWHDSQETRTGDVSRLARRYAQRVDPAVVTADQTAGMPGPVGEMVRGLVAEYEARETPEAICARDADKLECLLQGVEYKAQGHPGAQRWIDNSRRRLVTDTAQRLADQLLDQDPLDWLHVSMGEAPPSRHATGARRDIDDRDP